MEMSSKEGHTSQYILSPDNTQRHQCYLIGMIHVPINTLVASPKEWRKVIGLPEPKTADWQLIYELDEYIKKYNKSWLSDYLTQDYGIEILSEASERCASLSYFPYLQDRVLSEADMLSRNGFECALLENTAAPYFVRTKIPIVIPAVMLKIIQSVIKEFPNFDIGLQLLAFSDNLALQIAIPNKVKFIRCESLLFEGTRPEGHTPNVGNLASIYLMRDILKSKGNYSHSPPLVFVDLMKKHTIFQPGLNNIDKWLENILFQKLEGIIVTGTKTGDPVDEEELKKARNYIDKNSKIILNIFDKHWKPPIIVGSGISYSNIPRFKKISDGIIVGSFLKKGNFWEAPLDEENLRRFIDVWQNA